MLNENLLYRRKRQELSLRAMMKLGGLGDDLRGGDLFDDLREDIADAGTKLLRTSIRLRLSRLLGYSSSIRPGFRHCEDSKSNFILRLSFQTQLHFSYVSQFTFYFMSGISRIFFQDNFLQHAWSSRPPRRPWKDLPLDLECNSAKVRRNSSCIWRVVPFDTTKSSSTDPFWQNEKGQRWSRSWDFMHYPITTSVSHVLDCKLRDFSLISRHGRWYRCTISRWTARGTKLDRHPK